MQFRLPSGALVHWQTPKCTVLMSMLHLTKQKPISSSVLFTLKLWLTQDWLNTKDVGSGIKHGHLRSFTLLHFPRASAADGCISAGR